MKINYFKNKNKGFSILELVIASIIFSAFIFAVYALLDLGIKSWNIGSTRTDIQNTGVFIIRRMTRELTMSTRKSLVIDPNGEYIAFETPFINGEYKYNQDNLGFAQWEGHIIYYFYKDDKKLYRRFRQHSETASPIPVTSMEPISTIIVPPSAPTSDHKAVGSNINKFNVYLSGSIIYIKLVCTKSSARIDDPNNARFSVTGTADNKGLESFELQGCVEPKN